MAVVNHDRTKESISASEEHNQILFDVIVLFSLVAIVIFLIISVFILLWTNLWSHDAPSDMIFDTLWRIVEQYTGAHFQRVWVYLFLLLLLPTNFFLPLQFFFYVKGCRSQAAVVEQTDNNKLSIFFSPPLTNRNCLLLSLYHWLTDWLARIISSSCPSTYPSNDTIANITVTAN